jgi:type I restriction enzyme S subunit
MGGVSMEWKEVRLGDIADVQTGPFGSQLHKSDYIAEGIPCIMPTNIGPHLNFIVDGIAHVSEVDANRLSRHLTEIGDIIYARRGDIEKCAYVTTNEEKWLCGTGCLKIRCNNEVNSRFIAYLLSTAECKKWITGNAVGTTMLNLSKGILSNLPLLVPSHEDQRRIASILSSLDRKIELNNKINADLEEMAQAIFKNWFVDFEPFKDGKFVDSELGMIPEEWKVGRLGELCNFKRGKNLLTKNAIDEGVPVVAGGLEPSCYHNVANTGAPVITVSGSGANAGFMRMYHVPIWASDCSFIDISCENFYFVYCFLKVNSKLLKHAQTGAVQPHVKPSDIHDFELVIPDKESIYDFQDKVKPFFDRIASLQKESSRLSLLRLSLLPRLMSGELEVPE